MRIALFIATGVLALVLHAGVRAQAAEPLQDNISMDDYLAALQQINPAARDGAEAYLEAFRNRCGRAMRTIELRLAVASGESGDPVLMGMIRAAHLRDTAMQQRMAAAIVCPRR